MEEYGIPLYAFYYSDYEYFQWFRKKNAQNYKRVVTWKGLYRNPDIRGLYEYIWPDGEFCEQYVADNFRTPVTRAFICHLERPLECPILDVNVWTAMRDLDDNAADLPQKPATWQHYDRYRNFFGGHLAAHANDIPVAPIIQGLAEEHLRHRMVDRALWEYGRVHGMQD